MKSWNNSFLCVLVVAIVGSGSVIALAEESPKIPGAGSGSGSSMHESIIEGTLDKYDPVHNKITIKGIDEDRMTLDAIASLKAKEGTRRMPMAMVKQGQKIRVIYTEKGKRKIAKDVEVVKDEEVTETSSKQDKSDKPGKSDSETPSIPGADK